MGIDETFGRTTIEARAMVNWFLVSDQVPLPIN